MSEHSVAFSGNATPEGPVQLFEPEPAYPVDGSFVSIDMLHRVKAMPVGSALLVASELSGVGSEDLTGRFIEDKEKELGKTREDHTHHMEFGQFVLSSPEDRERNRLAVIKVFDRPEQAIHEFAVSDYVNRIHNYKPDITYVPLGFMRLSRSDTALITAYDGSVISYDNTFWDLERVPKVDEVKKALGNSALSLAWMHNAGLANGDARIKNMAAGNLGPRIIDLEAATLFPLTIRGTAHTKKTRELIERDIKMLAGSLNEGIDDTAENIARDRDYTLPLRCVFASHYERATAIPSSKIPPQVHMNRAEIADLVLDAINQV